jgi:prefoldin subunit 5
MRKNNLKISFFAFQDIITSTTGILILITIILTFFIKAGGAPSGPDPDQIQDEIAKMKWDIDETKQTINNLTGMIAKWGTLDPAVVQAEIEDLEEKLGALENELENLGEDQEEVIRLVEMLARLKKKGEELAGEHQRILTEIEDLKKTINNIDKAKKLFMIPEVPGGKKLLLIVLAAAKLEVIEFAPPADPVRKVFNNRGDLLGHLGTKNPKDKYHVVFFVRPSGIKHFMLLNGGKINPNRPKPVHDLGFPAIGWEPLEEDVELGLMDE